MADNTTINSMSGGDVIASDDISGVKYQRVKVDYGADGSATDVDATHGLPIATVPLTSLGTAKATVTTAATRVQLGTNTCVSVTVRARALNAGLIYVGGSAVASSNGYDLSPGESISLDVSNTNLIYVDAATNGDQVSYVWVN